ncbi:MAG: response regulator [Planctomycetes bacterium]|nr:response regulator [Planctomycetota bacterium]
MRTTPNSESFDILLTEDDSYCRDLIRSIFEVAKWQAPVVAQDGLEALQHLNTHHADILITDLNMPRLGGEELIRRVRQSHPELVVLVITGNGSIDRAVSLMKAGVFDFITKPFTVESFLGSLRRAKEYVLHVSEMRGMREVVGALMVALESKDRYLQGHAGRVRDTAFELGRLFGLPRHDLKFLEHAALLHDVGKIGIHEDILNKPGKLTAEEYEIMKKHPIYSRDIIAPVGFLAPCLPAVLHHHERIDGKGYPHGLAGDDIPLGARIIAVVDTFDAMTSPRSYRSALPVEEVLATMKEVAGKQLDRGLVELFLAHFDEIIGQPQAAAVLAQ